MRVAPFVFVAIVFGVGTVTAADSDEELEWSCGTDTVSHWLSEATIDKSCPSLKNAINQCCVNHDQCYDDQLGRIFCDDTFCNCLQVAAKPSEECSEEDAPTFCILVREFGAPAYEASAKNGTMATNETSIDMTLSTNSTTTTAGEATENSARIKVTKIDVPKPKRSIPKVLRASRTAAEQRTITSDDVHWLSAAFNRMDAR